MPFISSTNSSIEQYSNKLENILTYVWLGVSSLSIGNCSSMKVTV